MIRTDLHTGQGLGNQLWVYAACRGIAENLSLPYSIGGIENFKGSNFLGIDLGVCDAESTGTRQASLRNYTIFRERLFYDPELKYFASDYDSRVKSLDQYSYLEGLFQSESYFYGRQSKLGDWIRLSEELKENSFQYADTCVINIRGGEYKRHKSLILPLSYWTRAIENIKSATGVDKFLIVTDDRAYARALFPDFRVLEGGIAECYSALYGAKCLIVSNSSFSYFPIKTRFDRPYVIAPYLWSRFSNRFARWASPANLYNDWNWQTEDGSLHSHDECIEIVEKTRNFYSNCYNVSVPLDAVRVSAGFRHIPNWIKKPIKLILSLFFPKLIGR